MLICPLLRPIDMLLLRGRGNLPIRRPVGLGGVTEYTFLELLDRSRYLYGSYEYVYSSAFVGQITPGSIALDVGANIGEYSLLAALSTGPKGRVLAVEPNQELHPRIRRNLELNDVSNVRILPIALGSFESHGTLTVPLGGPALGTLRSDVGGVEPITQFKVSIKRLDDILSDEERRLLSVVKVDVEGWELEVFRGGRATLAGSKPVVLYECGAEQFETRGTRTLTPSMAYLEEMGYRNHTIRMDRHGNWHLRPVEVILDPLSDREPWAVLMIVAVHPDARQRVKMQGQSPFTRCGILELLSRTSTAPTRGHEVSPPRHLDDAGDDTKD